MFVTSDIFDLKRIGHFRDFEWREHLLCGVAVNGSRWPGYQAAATFMLEAAKTCGLTEGWRWAGYNRVGEARTRPISPNSFERLAQGRLKGASQAAAVLLRGERPAKGAQIGDIIFGGDAGVRPADSRRANGRTGTSKDSFAADFLFPLEERWLSLGQNLLQTAASMLGAEYGYFFVRDDLCFPSAYTSGVGAALDYSKLDYEDTEEIGRWAYFVSGRREWRDTGGLWSAEWPLLRDLFQVNLLSHRHTQKRVPKLGYLTEWITARPGRGELEDLDDGRVLWTLTDQEMVDVRPHLNEAGILLSCRDRVYRDLPNSKA